ncbi:unnamed protein product, partial [Didymodactylos carnosus]
YWLFSNIIITIVVFGDENVNNDRTTLKKTNKLRDNRRYVKLPASITYSTDFIHRIYTSTPTQQSTVKDNRIISVPNATNSIISTSSSIEESSSRQTDSILITDEPVRVMIDIHKKNKEVKKLVITTENLTISTKTVASATTKNIIRPQTVSSQTKKINSVIMNHTTTTVLPTHGSKHVVQISAFNKSNHISCKQGEFYIPGANSNPSLKVTCTCRTIRIKNTRKIFPCHSCNCTNVERFDLLPFSTSVVDLRLYNSSFTDLSTIRKAKSRYNHNAYINLELLEIHQSNIKELTYNDIEPLINLKTLIIRNASTFKSFTNNTFNRSIHLETIIVEDTGLYTFHENLIRFKQKIKLLKLNGNRLQCHCDLNWLKKGLSDYQSFMIDVDQCYFRGLPFSLHIIELCDGKCTRTTVCDPNDTCFEIKIGHLNWHSCSKQQQILESDCSKSRHMTLPNTCSCHQSDIRIAPLNKVCRCNYLASLSDIPDSYASQIIDLHLTDPSIINLNDNNLCRFKLLHKLQIDSGRIKSIDSQSFRHNPLLIYLQIKNNQNKLILKHDSFNNSYLEQIHIEKSHLINIPNNTFSVLRKYLKELNLNGNNISKISLINLEQLKKVNLANNDLSLLTIGDFIGLKSLNIVDITDNKIPCSCGSIWLQQWSRLQPNISKLLNLSSTTTINGATCTMGTNLKLDFKYPYYDICNPCLNYKCPTNQYRCVNISGTYSCVYQSINEKYDCNQRINRSYPVSTHCDRFFLCNDDSSDAKLLTCPSPLLFNNNSQRCVFSSKSTCNTIVSKQGDESNSHYSCPLQASSIIPEEHFNTRLNFIWADIENQSDEHYGRFQTMAEFIETIGFYRHDRHECQGYHRCHYNKFNGLLEYSDFYRCSPGKFFDNHYDTCRNYDDGVILSIPDQYQSCRCNYVMQQIRQNDAYYQMYGTMPQLEQDEPDPCSYYKSFV